MSGRVLLGKLRAPCGQRTRSVVENESKSRLSGPKQGVQEAATEASGSDLTMTQVDWHRRFTLPRPERTAKAKLLTSVANCAETETPASTWRMGNGDGCEARL